MSDDRILRSGSRWEPEPGTSSERPEPSAGARGPEPQDGTVETTAQQPAISSPNRYHGEAARTDRGTSRLRGRAALAASGLGLAVISALGGFGLSHAAAGDTGDVGDSSVVRTDDENGGGQLGDDDRNRLSGVPGDDTAPTGGSAQSDQGASTTTQADSHDD